jgi:ABC-type glycerol-3-phosphate transport system permease component
MIRRIPKISVYTIFSIFAIAMLIPYVWMLLLSFKAQKEISAANTFLPETWTMQNYVKVFDTVPMVNWFFNSLIVAGAATAIVLFTSTLVGFVFAKYKFRHKNLIFWFILATMMVPPQTTMATSFMLIFKLGLYDKLPALFIPGMVWGFGIFLCRQFIEDLPDSLCEAALIDGANSFYIYWKIIVPLIRPAMGALGIFTFLMYWNEYMLPLLYISDPNNMTLSLAISFFSTQRTTDVGAIMAAATLVMLPVTVVFLAFQKQFIKSVAMTGGK